MKPTNWRNWPDRNGSRADALPADSQPLIPVVEPWMLDPPWSDLLARGAQCPRSPRKQAQTCGGDDNGTVC
jgi:hypothetical protein